MVSVAESAENTVLNSFFSKLKILFDFTDFKECIGSVVTILAASDRYQCYELSVMSDQYLVLAMAENVLSLSESKISY